MFISRTRKRQSMILVNHLNWCLEFKTPARLTKCIQTINSFANSYAPTATNQKLSSCPNARPLHPAWYTVAFVVAAFLAGIVIKWVRTGAEYPWRVC